jgi:hypothetical protein
MNSENNGIACRTEHQKKNETRPCFSVVVVVVVSFSSSSFFFFFFFFLLVGFVDFLCALFLAAFLTVSVSLSCATAIILVVSSGFRR